MTSAVPKLAAPITSAHEAVSVYRGGLEVIDQLADEWRDLCVRAVDDQPFYRPEWIRAHLRAFKPGANLVLIAVRIDGRLCLLLPMVEEKQIFSGLPVRKLRAPVNAHGGRFDAVRAQGPDGDLSISAAWKFLKQLGGWDLLEFRHTLAGSTIDGLMQKTRESALPTVQVTEKPNPYVRIPSNPELLDQMPRNSRLRTKLRQARRELSQLGSLNFFRVDVADRRSLDRFYELEASGWKGQEGSAIASNAQTRQFYDEIAESAARYGYLSLYMLELDGQLIAAHFSLTSPDKCYSPKVAYDENFKQFSPGHLIVGEILKDCAIRGIQGFDITGPDDEWKMKWTSETRVVNQHFVFKGAMGNLAHALRFRIRPAIGRRLLGKPKSA